MLLLAQLAASSQEQNCDRLFLVTLVALWLWRREKGKNVPYVSDTVARSAALACGDHTFGGFSRCFSSSFTNKR